MAKYLSRLGWNVTVLTPSPADSQGEPASQFQKLCIEEKIHRMFAGSQVAFPFDASLRSKIARFRYRLTQKFWRLLSPLGVNSSEVWYWPCRRALDKLGIEKWDVVYVTGSPFYPFLAVRQFCQRQNIPYVLDYRDPWSANNLVQNQWRWWIERLERKVIQDAAAVVMVSESQAKHQAQQFQLQGKIEVIHNGFEPESLQDIEPMVFDDIAIVYAGEFYIGQREVDPLIRAVQRANQLNDLSNKPFRLHYFGGASSYVQDIAQQLNATEWVVCHGKVSRQVALQAICGAAVTAVITGIKDDVGLVERGIVTGKLFEPLGLGTPILLIAPRESDARKIIEDSDAGKCFRASEIESMATWLSKLSPHPQCNIAPNDFSWNNLAEKVDQLLLRVVN